MAKDAKAETISLQEYQTRVTEIMRKAKDLQQKKQALQRELCELSKAVGLQPPTAAERVTTTSHAGTCQMEKYPFDGGG
jgi:hypothetical protein